MDDRLNVKIRLMDREDATAIARMMAALANHHGDVSTVSADDVMKHGMGPGRIATIWVALLDDRPAGFAVTYDRMNFVRGYPIRHVDLLFVEAMYRNSGVGTTLIRNIVHDATASACQRVTIGAVKANPIAHAFYHKLGFEPRDSTAIQYQIAGAPLDRLALLP